MIANIMDKYKVGQVYYYQDSDKIFLLIKVKKTLLHFKSTYDYPIHVYPKHSLNRISKLILLGEL